MVPVEIDFPGRLNRKSLRFSVVRHEQVLPMIAATGLAQAVTGSNESGFTRGFRVTTTVDFPGSLPVELSQLYPGPQGFNQGLKDFVGNLSLWLFNPYERIFQTASALPSRPWTQARRVWSSSSSYRAAKRPRGNTLT